MDSTSSDIKSAAHGMVDSLPSTATWDDLTYRVYVRQCIDADLDDARYDRVVDVNDVRKQFKSLHSCSRRPTHAFGK